MRRKAVARPAGVDKLPAYTQELSSAAYRIKMHLGNSAVIPSKEGAGLLASLGMGEKRREEYGGYNSRFTTRHDRQAWCR
jgi:hypothetical protein